MQLTIIIILAILAGIAAGIIKEFFPALNDMPRQAIIILTAFVVGIIILLFQRARGTLHDDHWQKTSSRIRRINDGPQFGRRASLRRLAPRRCHPSARHLSRAICTASKSDAKFRIAPLACSSFSCCDAAGSANNLGPIFAIQTIRRRRTRHPRGRR